MGFLDYYVCCFNSKWSVLLWSFSKCNIAVLVLIAINIYTLVQGSKIKRNQTISLFEIFNLSGLSKKAKVFKISFLLITCLLMILGYSLFAKEMIWSVSYALSGGVLLLFLYIWKNTSVQLGCIAG